MHRILANKPKVILILWMICWAFIPSAIGQRVKKIKNINKRVSSQYSTEHSPTGVQIASIDSVFFFAMGNKKYGTELWRSNGTASGTYMVKDIFPGDYDSFPDQFLSHQGILYFTARTEAGRFLWRSDGTEEGTFVIQKFDSSDFILSRILSGEENFYFRVELSSGGVSLWKSNGTESGTEIIENIDPSDSSSLDFGDLYFFKGKLYYSRYFSNGIFQIYSTNGTPYEATPFKEWQISPFSFHTIKFFSLNDELYFASRIDPLIGIWKTDGTTNGTIRISEQEVWTYRGIIEFKGDAYFFYSNNLWKTDGKEGGTHMVKTFHANAFLEESFFKKSSNLLYFNYNNSNVEGAELWRSDGTESGTFLVKDIQPGYQSSYIYDPIIFDDKLYFTALTESSGREVWRTNGTAQQTQILKETLNGPKSLLPHALFEHNGTLYFFDEEFNGWKSAGNALTTDMYVQNKTENNYSNPRGFLTFKGLTYFSASENLWRTDGTENGTNLVHEKVFYAKFSKTNNYLFFVAGSTVNSFDGTTTTDIWNYSLGNPSITKFLSTDFPDYLIFSAFDDVSHYNKLYKSDGTPSSATLIKDLYPGEEIYFDNVVQHEGLIYFTVRNGSELWRTDGTPSGTIILRNNIRIEEPMVISNGKLYFIAGFSNTEFYDYELWKSDGTPSGTVVVYDTPFYNQTKKNIFEVNGLIFYLSLENGTNQLYRSDGTPMGTYKINLPFDPLLTPLTGLFFQLNHSLVFSTYSDDGVQTLYRFNTTNDHISQITLTGNTKFSGIIEGKQFKNYLYFSASASGIGTELWKTDGETAVLVKNISENWRGSYPQNFFISNGIFYFSANDRMDGHELYKFNNCQEGEDLSITEDVFPGHIIELSGKDYINSISTLHHSSMTIYESGKSITLNPGFETNHDVYFQANIIPCE